MSRNVPVAEAAKQRNRGYETGSLINLDVSMPINFDAMDCLIDAALLMEDTSKSGSSSSEPSSDVNTLTIGIGLDIGSKFTAYCAYRSDTSSPDWPSLHKNTLKATPLGCAATTTANLDDDKKEETLIAIPIDARKACKHDPNAIVFDPMHVYFGEEARNVFNLRFERGKYYFFSDFKQMIQTGSKERGDLRDGEGLEKILVPSLTVKDEKAQVFISVFDLISVCIFTAVRQGVKKIFDRELEEKDVENIRLCLTVPDAADNHVVEFMLRAAKRVKFTLADQNGEPKDCAIPSSQITIMMESIASGVHALYRSCMIGEDSNPLANVETRLRNMDVNGVNLISLERALTPEEIAALTPFKEQEKHLFKCVHLDVGGGTHDGAIIKCGVHMTEKGIRPINKEISAISNFGGNHGGEVIEQAVLSFLLANVFNDTTLDEGFLKDNPSVRYQLLSQLRKMKTAVFQSTYPMYGMTDEVDDLTYWAADSRTRFSSRHLMTNSWLKLSRLRLSPEMLKLIAEKKINNSITRSFAFDKMKVEDLKPLNHQGAVGSSSSSAAPAVAALDSFEFRSEEGDIQLSVSYRLFFLAAAAQAKLIEEQLTNCINEMQATRLVPGTNTVEKVCEVYPDVVFMSGSGSLNTLLNNRIKRLCDTLSNKLADPANLNGPKKSVKFIAPPENSTHCVKGAVHCALLQGQFLATSTFVADKSYAVTTVYTKKEVGDDYGKWETQQQQQEQRTNPWSILHGMRENHNLDESFEYITPLADCQIGDLITVNTKYYIKDFEGKPLIYQLTSGVPLVIKVCTSNEKFTSVAEKGMLVKGYNGGEVGDAATCTKISEGKMRRLITGRYNYTNETGEMRYAIFAFKFLPNKTFLVVVEFVKSLTDGTRTGQTITMELRSGPALADTASSSSPGGIAATTAAATSSSGSSSSSSSSDGAAATGCGDDNPRKKAKV